MKIARESSGSARRIVGDGLVMTEHVQTFGATHHEYFGCSQRKRTLLVDDVIRAGDGFKIERKYEDVC